MKGDRARAESHPGYRQRHGNHAQEREAEGGVEHDLEVGIVEDDPTSPRAARSANSPDTVDSRRAIVRAASSLSPSSIRTTLLPLARFGWPAKNANNAWSRRP
jgi:hypothetical protein